MNSLQPEELENCVRYNRGSLYRSSAPIHFTVINSGWAEEYRSLYRGRRTGYESKRLQPEGLKKCVRCNRDLLNRGFAEKTFEVLSG